MNTQTTPINEDNRKTAFDLTPDYNTADEPSKDDACPQCSKLWTVSEVEFQQCDGCGYPLTEQRHKHH